MNNQFEELTQEQFASAQTEATQQEAVLNEVTANTFENGTKGEERSLLEKLGIEQVDGYEFLEADQESVLSPGNDFVSSSEDEIETIEQLESLENIDDLEEAYFASYEAEKTIEAFNKELTTESVIGRDDRIKIRNTRAYPFRAICSLLIEAKTGRKYIGTGWFISPRTVVTAGHCLYLHNQGGWAKSITVMPGRNGNTLPYGSAKATRFRSVKGWTADRNQNFDYGAIILPADKRLGARTGWFGFANLNDSTLKSKHVNISGYPGDKPRGEQHYHHRNVASVNSRKVRYTIDTFGGQSGSPVFYINGELGARYAVGIHAYGLSGGTNSATRIVKPVFDNLVTWKRLGM